jgi:UPF0716 protein FxsA
VLVLLFLVLPVVDIWLLVQIGHRIGFWPTFAMLVVTAIIGVQLAKAEGLRVLQKVQRAFAEGHAPERELVSGLLVFVGGALLVVPGLISDALGIVLLVPPTRALVARLLRRRWANAIAAGRIVVDVAGMGGPVRRERDDLDDEIIDVEAESVDNPPKSLPKKPQE